MSNPATSPPLSHRRYFFEKFGITERLLERCLGEALSAGGDYADLYFESVTSTSLGVDEQIVKSASQGTSAGLRNPRAFRRADRLCLYRQPEPGAAAACGADGGADRLRAGEAAGAGIYGDARLRTFIPVPLGGFDLDLAARLELILRADRAARAFDSRIVQVRAGYSEELRRILIAASDGAFASDTQPLCRLNVFVIAKDGATTTKGSSGGGGTSGAGAIHREQEPGAPGAGGGARSDSAAWGGACAGRRDGGGAGTGMARSAAARGSRAWA